MKYVIIYDDGKYFEVCNSYEEAKEILDEAIEYMDGDNWCGLHIVERKKEEVEI